MSEAKLKALFAKLGEQARKHDSLRLSVQGMKTQQGYLRKRCEGLETALGNYIEATELREFKYPDCSLNRLSGEPDLVTLCLDRMRAEVLRQLDAAPVKIPSSPLVPSQQQQPALGSCNTARIWKRCHPMCLGFVGVLLLALMLATVAALYHQTGLLRL